MFTLKAHPQLLNTFCMTFVPGERPLLATGGDDGIHIWDLATRKSIRHHFIESDDNPAAVTCSPDGRLIAICQGATPAIVRLWDWEANRIDKEFISGEQVQCAVFSPTGDALALGGFRISRGYYDYRVRRLRTATWKPQRLLAGHTGQTGFIDFSPDGRLLATGAADQRAILWDLARTEALLTVPHDTVVWGVAFSPDGRFLATTGGRTVKLIDVAKRKLIRGQLRGHRKVIHGIAFLRDGRTLASVSEDGTVRLWDVATRKVLRVFDWGIGPLHCIGFSADGMLGAAGAADGSVVVWDID